MKEERETYRTNTHIGERCSPDRKAWNEKNPDAPAGSRERGSAGTGDGMAAGNIGGGVEEDCMKYYYYLGRVVSR
jgi:hypothetical protein